MRIVGGKFKSVRFKPPKGFKSRPTTDFAKEGLFNVLTHKLDLHDAEILDLFCGTGNISFEFLSRGAKVTSVDQNFKCVKYVKEIALSLKASNDIITHRNTAEKFLSTSEASYDIIFMDPPFDIKDYKDLIELVYSLGKLKKEGLLIVEHHKKIDLSDIAHFSFLKKYGSVSFSFFDPLN